MAFRLRKASIWGGRCRETLSPSPTLCPPFCRRQGLLAPSPGLVHSQSPAASSRPRGWTCWPPASPACGPSAPSRDTPAPACPFFMAGPALIPGAERWARGRGQERRDCLLPPAALGSSGPAGWPRGDMFILQACRWPRLLAGSGAGLAGTGTGWRLGAAHVPEPLSFPPVLTFKEAERGLRAPSSPFSQEPRAGLSRETPCGQGVQGPGPVRLRLARWVGAAGQPQSLGPSADPCRAPGVGRAPDDGSEQDRGSPVPRGGRPSRERPVVPRWGSPRT